MVITLLDLAYLLHEQGDLKLAENYTEQALDHVMRGGVDSRRLAGFLSNRGNNLADAGDLEAAEVLLRQALAMKARLFGQDELELDRIRHSLASVLNKRGKFEEAEELFLKNLSVREKYHGRQSAEVAWVLNNLVLLLEIRNPKAAEAAARESLEIRRNLGWEPLQLAVSQNNLAAVLRYQGRYEESEALYREVLTVLEAEQGEKHRTVGFVLVGLSSTLLGLERPQEAEELARRALDIFHYNFDSNHWRIAAAESTLGASLLAQGRVEEAEPLLRRSLRVLEEVRGPEASATLEAAQRVRALEGDGMLVFVVEVPQ
jgi:tetratricopeptide (TPR) repeat protein